MNWQRELMEGKATRLIIKGSHLEEWLNSFKAMNIKLPLLRSITPEYGPMDIIESKSSAKVISTQKFFISTAVSKPAGRRQRGNLKNPSLLKPSDNSYQVSKQGLSTTMAMICRQIKFNVDISLSQGPELRRLISITKKPQR